MEYERARKAPCARCSFALLVGCAGHELAETSGNLTEHASGRVYRAAHLAVRSTASTRSVNASHESESGASGDRPARRWEAHGSSPASIRYTASARTPSRWSTPEVPLAEGRVGHAPADFVEGYLEVSAGGLGLNRPCGPFEAPAQPEGHLVEDGEPPEIVEDLARQDVVGALPRLVDDGVAVEPGEHAELLYGPVSPEDLDA